MTRSLAADWVAIILAIALGVGLNCFCFAVLWDALRSDTPGLSENATQVLTGWGGGMVGVLGAYVGWKIGRASCRERVWIPV